MLAYHFSPWKLERLKGCPSLPDGYQIPTCLWCQVLAEAANLSGHHINVRKCTRLECEFMWSYIVTVISGTSFQKKLCNDSPGRATKVFCCVPYWDHQDQSNNEAPRWLDHQIGMSKNHALSFEMPKPNDLTMFILSSLRWMSTFEHWEKNRLSHLLYQFWSPEIRINAKPTQQKGKHIYPKKHCW